LAHRKLRTKGGSASAVADVLDRVSGKPPGKLYCCLNPTFPIWVGFALKNDVGQWRIYENFTQATLVQRALKSAIASSRVPE
jgi:hypothetical protein